MKIVGDHLANVAVNSGDARQVDLFGRSAFNRYYYSAFLAVRTALRTIDSKWATPTHKDAPTVLKGEVLRRAKKQIKILQDTGQITNTKGEQLKHAAITAASEVSNLLSFARGIRRVADYEPEQTIQKTGSVIKLAECKLDTAKFWENRVEVQTNTILSVYEQIGLI